MPRAESVEAAREAVVEKTGGLTGVEVVGVSAAAGRVLAHDLVAGNDMPPFDSAAMDGFAALPTPASTTLQIVGESRAGHPFAGTLAEGEAIAISTGAVAPQGAGVAPVETVAFDGATVTPNEAISGGDHVRRAGEDFRAGETALASGTLLRPSHLQVAAACGFAHLQVAARPRVAIVATGDELAAPGTSLAPGQIHESNGTALKAIAEACGCEVVSVARIADDQAATLAALADAIDSADIVLASGGISVGEHDHVRPALDELGVEEIFWRVPLKPGGPTWFGKADGGTLVFGLPGNPAAAYVTFSLFARPAARKLQGLDPFVERWPAELAEPVELRNRAQAIRVTIEPRGDGPLLARPTGAQGSHRTASLAGAWGVAIIPAGEGELAAGSAVEVEPLP